MKPNLSEIILRAFGEDKPSLSVNFCILTKEMFCEKQCKEVCIKITQKQNLMSAKVTVSFIYQYYNSDESVFNFLLDDILKCANHTDIKYFIHKYEVKNNIIKNIKFDKQGTSVTQVTEKEYDVPDYHFDLLLAKNKWTRFFTNYAKAENAESNIIFLIQHSNGYGTRNKETSYLQNKEGFNKQISIIEDAVNKYKSISLQQINTGGDLYRLIPYSVLSEAIQSSFNGKKIDLLFLNNCFSQTLEAGLVFNKCATHLCSSQSTIPGFGPNFKEFFKYLEQAVKDNGKPAISHMAKNLVDNFKQKFSESRILEFLRKIAGNENKPDSELSGFANLHCFSINNLEKYPAILNALNTITNTPPNTDLSNAICKIRKREIDILCRDVSLDPVNELSLVDMHNLFEQILKEQPSISLPNDFLQTIKGVVIDRYFPDPFFNPPAGTEYYKIMPHGISFFLPHTIQYNGQKNQRLYSTGQLILNLIIKDIDVIEIKNTNWFNFLKFYITNTC
jgi:hypothetical protein